MVSKHHGWQQRWAFDDAWRVATHESGLQVEWRAGEAMALNAPAAQAALAARHGPHNAPAMVTRLLREAGKLFSEGAGRG